MLRRRTVMGHNPETEVISHVFLITIAVEESLQNTNPDTTHCSDDETWDAGISYGKEPSSTVDLEIVSN